MAYMGHVIVRGYIPCARVGCGHEQRWHEPCNVAGCTGGATTDRAVAPCPGYVPPADDDALASRTAADAPAGVDGPLVPPGGQAGDVAAPTPPSGPVVRAYDRCARGTCGHDRRWHAVQGCSVRLVPDGPLCGCPVFVTVEQVHAELSARDGQLQAELDAHEARPGHGGQPTPVDTP